MGETVANRLLSIEQWCVGWAKTSIDQFLRDPRAVTFEWIKPRHNAELIADPFGFERNGKLEIFAEYLNYGHTKGQIKRFALDDVDLDKSAVLERSFHLSYPFIVEEDGRHFMIPEQGESGSLAFYPLQDDQLGPPACVISGLDAIDPTFIRHDGLWWLFCGRLSASPQRQLYLYFSERLFGPYRPHPDNPIVRDVTHARPAGRIIKTRGGLLRPAQDCSSSYGAAITLCAIEEMTPERYRETPVQRIAPQQITGGFTAGLHTLDHTDQFVLIDTKRMTFAPLAVPIKFAHRRYLRG